MLHGNSGGPWETEGGGGSAGGAVSGDGGPGLHWRLHRAAELLAGDVPGAGGALAAQPSVYHCGLPPPHAPPGTPLAFSCFAVARTGDHRLVLLRSSWKRNFYHHRFFRAA